MKIETEPKVFSLWTAELNKALSQLSTEYFPNTTLAEGVNYILSMEGKRVRPLMVLLTASLLGKETELEKLPMKTALAVEVFHNFTLVHDDWMDNASLRRKQRTLHTLTSPAYAVLVGDALFALAQKLIVQDENNADVAESASFFASAGMKVCEGQSLELALINKPVSLENYLRVLELKTAELIATSFALGAIATGNKREIHSFYELGKNIGIYFQLQDDIMDFFPPTHKFGKIIGGDILENKKTILWFVTYKEATREDRQKLIELFDLPATEKLNAAGELFEKYEARQKAWDFIKTYEEKILALIQEINTRYPNDLLLPLFLNLKNRNQ